MAVRSTEHVALCRSRVPAIPPTHPAHLSISSRHSRALQRRTLQRRTLQRRTLQRRTLQKKQHVDGSVSRRDGSPTGRGVVCGCGASSRLGGSLQHCHRHG